MSGSVLLVDDEVQVLDSYRRRLMDQFSLDMACGGEEALHFLDRQKVPAVIVSDLRMPKMDGLALLRQFRSASPTTIRMILSGNADLEAATQAVNDGEIFRFLTKPCSPEVLERALSDGIRHHAFLSANESALETIASILGDLLELVAPESFRRGSQLRSMARDVARRMNLGEHWEIDLAAFLTCVGHITLPSDLVARYNSGRSLNQEDSTRMQRSRAGLSRVLRRCISLEPVADILQWAGHSMGSQDSSGDSSSPATAILGAVEEFASGIKRGQKAHEILAYLRQKGIYRQAVLEALAGTAQEFGVLKAESVSVEALTTGMILDQDLTLPNGILLLRKGREITTSTRDSLLAYVAKGSLSGEVSVLLPGSASCPTNRKSPALVNCASAKEYS